MNNAIVCKIARLLGGRGNGKTVITVLENEVFYVYLQITHYMVMAPKLS